MAHIYRLAALLLALAAAAFPARADGPLLAELFTSQGCSSCPSAEAYFAELADDPDLVTIEWHVDYWDYITVGGKNWKDPYAQKAFTERQRAYNQSLRGVRQVYTPQAVVMGDLEFVGNRGADMHRARKAAPRPTVSLAFADGKVSVSGKGSGEVIFVRLLKAHETDVSGGENTGRKLKGRHLALARLSLGAFEGKPASFTVPAVGKGETCAVFVQEAGQGRVLGAGYCPTSAPAR